MFKSVRIIILLLILFFVALQTTLTKLRSTDWDQPLWVVVYPINGDGSDRAARFIEALEEHDFYDIEAFFISQGQRYKLDIDEPMTVLLAPEVTVQPPMPKDRNNMLDVILWSLKLRYWSWRQDNFDGPKPDVQIFVRYFDPQQNPRLSHSLGIQKGMVGVVNAFASDKMAGSNNVIIAHELMHTVGATDKYDMGTNQPLYPIGYANPEQQPLLPQSRAELMGGRIPITENESHIPHRLASVVIGEATAIEIGWLDL